MDGSGIGFILLFPGYGFFLVCVIGFEMMCWLIIFFFIDFYQLFRLNFYDFSYPCLTFLLPLEQVRIFIFYIFFIHVTLREEVRGSFLRELASKKIFYLIELISYFFQDFFYLFFLNFVLGIDPEKRMLISFNQVHGFMTIWFLLRNIS